MPHPPAPRIGKLVAAAFFLLCAHPAWAATPSERAAAEVTSRIEAGDCVQAVERLKDGLKKEYGDVELLAGSLYENGVCLKRDWSRAVLFYMRAHGHGMKQAAGRLAAGYADPLNGPDMAAALWWAVRGNSANAASFGISEAAAADPGRFVAELGAWEPAHLAKAGYVVGVLFTIASEMRYPALAQRHGLGGEVIMRFLPGAARIELRKGPMRDGQLLGVVTADTLRDRGATTAKESFDTLLGQVAARALKRYPQPPGFAPAEVTEVRFVFTSE